jgi:hypothetical protein
MSEVNNGQLHSLKYVQIWQHARTVLERYAHKSIPYIVTVLKLKFWMELRIFSRQPQLCVRSTSFITILTDTFHCCLVLDTEIGMTKQNITHFTHCQSTLVSEIKILHTFASDMTQF